MDQVKKNPTGLSTKLFNFIKRLFGIKVDTISNTILETIINEELNDPYPVLGNEYILINDYKVAFTVTAVDRSKQLITLSDSDSGIDYPIDINTFDLLFTSTKKVEF